ncbi:MAG TPA: amidohydrolase family protein [Polyangiaceae bacterium]|nr:amidohydrolase family protein [Polyangiaceae bacterium]
MILAASATACGSEGLPPSEDASVSDATPPDATPAKDSAAPDAGDAGSPDASADSTAPDGGADSTAPDGGPGDGGDGGPPPEPSIVPGLPGRTLLAGTILTATGAITGEVLVVGDTIQCVEPGNTCSSHPDAAGATRIETQGVISPGLIDTHNHILFDVFDADDWAPIMSYQNHDQWTNEPGYHEMLDVKHCLANDSQGKPAWCAATVYGTAAGSLRCEMDKWGELKGLVSGTTSIVGLPGTSAGCFGSLARSVDVSQNGLGTDTVQTSALFPPSDANAVCANFASGRTTSFIAHCGEGVDARSLNEFARLGVSTPPGCLYAPQTTLTHGVAFGANEFLSMAATGMKLVWSPQSNLSLYGATANIPLAVDSGVLIALGPDWSMGGSQNMLDELRFASNWSTTRWAGRFTSRDLVTMATANGATVLALDDRLGKIAPGYLADISVFRGNVGAPYDAVVTASPREVTLVMVGGVALYGDTVLEPSAPAAPGCETVDICGRPKFLCAATSTPANKLDQTFAQIQTALSQALAETDAIRAPAKAFSPLTPLVKCPPP